MNTVNYNAAICRTGRLESPAKRLLLGVSLCLTITLSAKPAAAELWKCTPNSSNVAYFTETPSFGDEVVCEEVKSATFSKPGGGASSDSRSSKKRTTKEAVKKKSDRPGQKSAKASNSEKPKREKKEKPPKKEKKKRNDDSSGGSKSKSKK